MLSLVNALGYPTEEMSNFIEPLLDTLADAPSDGPIRCPNVAERERLAGYAEAFEDCANRADTVDDYISGVITGSSFHELAFKRAVGGVSTGALYNFAHGIDSSEIVQPGPTRIADINTRYTTLIACVKSFIAAAPCDIGRKSEMEREI